MEAPLQIPDHFSQQPKVEPLVPAPTPIPEAPAAPIIPESTISGESKYFGVKLEYIVLGAISIMIASYTMSIIHYRKQIQTSNTIANLQNQIDQLKVK